MRRSRRRGRPPANPVVTQALQVTSLDTDLVAALGSGSVIAVHRRTCTLKTDAGELITLVAPELGNGPNAALVEPRPWAAGTRFTPIGMAGLSFAHGPALDWSAARRWSITDSAPMSPPSIDNVDTLLAALKQTSITTGLLPVLLELPPTSSIQRALSQQAAPLLVALPDPLAAQRLIGLGPGATPSGDDLLAGLLLTLHYANHPMTALREIAQNAPTTELGRALLGWAAVGRAREDVLLLLRDLFSLPGSAALARLESVLHYGASSGADLVAGIAIGLRIVANVEHQVEKYPGRDKSRPYGFQP
ncbi:MAG: DUF2877 domain-containing protein [Chloroflexi bacterium]|nr:DUF2877 domain-containing protein [Chloroflexota bacterium]